MDCHNHRAVRFPVDVSVPIEIGKNWPIADPDCPQSLKDYYLGKDRVEIKRPGWDDQLISEALLVARRSPDAQTKCGCVIASRDHCILGTGYNGFPRDINDELLPNLRPSKYPWMIHSEVNAILNCTIKMQNMVAYITSPPCLNCTLFMWQAGVREIVYIPAGHAKMICNEEYKTNMEIFKYLTKGALVWREYTPNMEHVEQLLSTFREVTGV